MSIINTIPVSTTTTKPTCKNLVREIIDGKSILEDGLTYLEEYFALRLEKGIVSSSCKVCCPDCGNTYFIGGTDIHSILNSTIGPFEECCKNIRTDSETVNDCTNQFTQCLQQLQTIVGNTNYNTLIDLGIIEYSTILGKTTICSIIQELQKSPVYSSTLLFNSFKIILQKGIVVFCDNERDISLVSSIDKFIVAVESGYIQI